MGTFKFLSLFLVNCQYLALSLPNQDCSGETFLYTTALFSGVILVFVCVVITIYFHVEQIELLSLRLSVLFISLSQ